MSYNHVVFFSSVHQCAGFILNFRVRNVRQFAECPGAKDAELRQSGAWTLMVYH